MIPLKTRLGGALLALALNLAATPAASAAAIPDYPFVHVTGSAFQAVLPDIATLDFEIAAVDADPAAARAVLETRVGEVRALMQHLGLDPEDAVVREVRQSLRKGEQAAGGAPLYELRCEVQVKVRNLTVWPALAGGLLGKPNLDGFASAFDLEGADRVHDELMAEALRDARRRAEVMAAALGRRVGPAMAATPEALKNLGAAMGLEREEFRYQRSKDASNARPQGEDREQLLIIPALKWRQPVDVVFRLENLPAAQRRAPLARFDHSLSRSSILRRSPAPRACPRIDRDRRGHRGRTH